VSVGKSNPWLYLPSVVLGVLCFLASLDDEQSHEQNLPISDLIEMVYQNKPTLVVFELANKEEFDESGYAEILRKSGLLMFRMMAVR
jgi:hypothetical protein